MEDRSTFMLMPCLRACFLPVTKEQGERKKIERRKNEKKKKERKERNDRGTDITTAALFLCCSFVRVCVCGCRWLHNR